MSLNTFGPFYTSGNAALVDEKQPCELNCSHERDVKIHVVLGATELVCLFVLLCVSFGALYKNIAVRGNCSKTSCTTPYVLFHCLHVLFALSAAVASTMYDINYLMGWKHDPSASRCAGRVLQAISDIAFFCMFVLVVLYWVALDQQLRRTTWQLPEISDLSNFTRRISLLFCFVVGSAYTVAVSLACDSIINSGPLNVDLSPMELNLYTLRSVVSLPLVVFSFALTARLAFTFNNLHVLTYGSKSMRVIMSLALLTFCMLCNAYGNWPQNGLWASLCKSRCYEFVLASWVDFTVSNVLGQFVPGLFLALFLMWARPAMVNKCSADGRAYTVLTVGTGAQASDTDIYRGARVTSTDAGTPFLDRLRN